MKERLSERIRELRNANGFTQESIAEQLEISRQKYIRIENGYTDVSLEILAKLANIYKITVGDITKVIDNEPVAVYRAHDKKMDATLIHEMMDVFYVNKQMYDKLHYEQEMRLNCE